MTYCLVKEFKGSVVGGLDPPGNSILGKAVKGVRATNPLPVGVNDRIEAPLKLPSRDSNGAVLKGTCYI